MGTVKAVPKEYKGYIDVLRLECPTLAEQLADFHGIGDVLDWMKEHGMTANAIDMIAQDEFEYDFVIQVPQAGWLVFGVT